MCGPFLFLELQQAVNMSAYFRVLNIVFPPNDFHYPEDQIRRVISHFRLALNVHWSSF